jgi:hypothetical protein
MRSAVSRNAGRKTEPICSPGYQQATEFLRKCLRDNLPSQRYPLFSSDYCPEQAACQMLKIAKKVQSAIEHPICPIHPPLILDFQIRENEKNGLPSP